MELVAIISSVASAVGSYEAGQQQKQMYQIQAQQATAEGERRSLQYQQKSNEVLRKRMQVNAALAARSYAGGVNPFSGSPDLVRAANDTTAGREYQMMLADADAAMRGGAIQARIYESAGEVAARRGAFDATTKLGTSVYMAYSGTQAPAPIETRYVN
jgi:hypothetical protein